MKVIKVDLPSELTQIELHTFADEHIGDENSDIKRVLQRIEYVKNTPNPVSRGAYLFLIEQTKQLAKQFGVEIGEE